MKKICPACKKEFDCKNDETCWCMKYEYPEELLEKLRNDYSDCLCEDCLKQFMDKYSKENQ